jgi:hypothetical protein
MKTADFNPLANESKLEKRTVCVSCGNSFTTVTAPFDKDLRPVVPGDYVVCGCCGEFLQFTEDLTCKLADFNTIDAKMLREMDLLSDVAAELTELAESAEENT